MRFSSGQFFAIFEEGAWVFCQIIQIKGNEIFHSEYFSELEIENIEHIAQLKSACTSSENTRFENAKLIAFQQITEKQTDELYEYKRIKSGLDFRKTEGIRLELEAKLAFECEDWPLAILRWTEVAMYNKYKLEPYIHRAWAYFYSEQFSDAMQDVNFVLGIDPICKSMMDLKQIIKGKTS